MVAGYETGSPFLRVALRIGDGEMTSRIPTNIVEYDTRRKVRGTLTARHEKGIKGKRFMVQYACGVLIVMYRVR